MSDDVDDMIEKLLAMTEMTEEEKARFKQVYNQLKDLRRMDDINDIKDANIDLDEFDIDEMDDVQELFDKINDLPISSIGNFDLDELNVDDIAEYFDGVSDYKYEPSNDEVEVEITKENSNYYGEEWVQTEDGYETFISLSDKQDTSDITISLNESSIEVSDPISKSLDIDSLPTTVQSVDAEKRDNYLIIRVLTD